MTGALKRAQSWAAEEVGAKRFIPSEFGSDINNLTDLKHFNYITTGSCPLFFIINVKLPSISARTPLSSTRSSTSITIFFFAEWDLTAGKAIIIGDGNDHFTVEIEQSQIPLRRPRYRFRRRHMARAPCPRRKALREEV
ncbi:hypothetical protein BC938DRAFT_471335 [Jimgerdemannia flammicorona]|uniref:Uncharacterized protein n=1 Tax=Jimgerdemannia flammicorona TaxID=994334 RepID=A0A433R015_9FUNG|nr:hypothetical protein BC938DRAFT_471335 [Jimgerdemannia flammicorona]